MKGKWLLFSASVILLAIAAGALNRLRQQQTPPTKQAPAQQPQPVNTEGEIALMGKIQAANITPIPAPVDGYLEGWDIEVGQEVAEGQLIGNIQNSGLAAAKQQAQEQLESLQNRIANLESQILAAKLESARADAEASRVTSEAARLEKIYSRQAMLFKEGATPRLHYEKAEKEYKAAKEEADTGVAVAKGSTERVAKLEADLRLMKTGLEDREAAVEEASKDMEAANILAPVDGLVIKLAVEPGAEVNRSMQDLVQIATDPDLLEVVVEPEPAALERIQQGMPALVQVPDVTSEGLEGSVKEVKGNQVIVEFTSPYPAIKHGMSAAVRIKIR
ncbi:MAG: efflux RND transporter periplasmic adaptor subunit [Acidobacteria bacterium]|nr:efflux RND transporter periplasmic adaptor subunit [Acidobacteriota bacterium]